MKISKGFKSLISKIKWCDYIAKELNKKDDFVEYKKYTKQIEKTKLIAFYLPQFHQFKENNEWHGKGFTDWNNTVKSIPLFEGHYQPHLPYDVGFYDLTHDDIMKRQVELAKNYGISGFCFHYYWFSGKRLMEKPIFNWLNNNELDLPFCLCWANENWSKLWDGGNKEVLMKQELKDEDNEKFLQDILPFFQDKRYIKIDNKPLLIIYKTECVPEDKLKSFINYIRTQIKNYDFDDIYLLTTNSFVYDENKANSAKALGFDATIEFPPHGLRTHESSIIPTPFVSLQSKTPFFKIFNGTIFDMQRIIKEKFYKTNAKFKCVFPSWDNSPRKAQTGCMIMQTSIEDYKKWLKESIKDTKENNSTNEQLIFINAWNEWAEGAHLEPDQKYGYAYLNATRNVLEEFE